MLASVQATMPVAKIKIGKRARRNLGDIAAFAAEIDAIGLLQPIVVDAHGQLIAGYRRIEAWKRSRFAKQEIPVHRVDIEAIARGEWSENVQRKAFTPTEAVALARLVEPMLKTEAQRRQSAGGQGVKVAERHITRDLLGRHCGLSGRSLAKAIAVVDAAAAEPEKFSGVLQQMDVTGNVDAAFRAVAIVEAKRALQSPSIFRRTLIGRVPLGSISVPELRWLVGFFTALGANLPVAPTDAMSVSEFLSERQVQHAIKSAERMRRTR